MAGDILLKERAVFSLETNGASISNGSAIAAATSLDGRSGGNMPDDWCGMFELVCQWATITGIAAKTIAADLYLVPSVDGTNFPDIDPTSGASYISYNHYVGSFECAKAPTANTNMRFVSPLVYLDQPALYKAYLIGKAGQTISAAWTLKAISARGQYT